MKNLLFISLLLVFASCSSQPAPLVKGDECSSCSMTIEELRYGAELVTEKGKVYKFDDIYCLVNFTNGELKATEKIKSTLVSDYNSSKLIDVNSAWFLLSDKLRTPMNGKTAAFSTQEEAVKLQNEFPGDILKWSELKDRIK